MCLAGTKRTDRNARLCHSRWFARQWLAARGKAKSGEYAEAMVIDARTARRHLGHFEVLGLVKKTGSGPSQQYEVK